MADCSGWPLHGVPAGRRQPWLTSSCARVSAVVPRRSAGGCARLEEYARLSDEP